MRNIYPNLGAFLFTFRGNVDLFQSQYTLTTLQKGHPCF